MKKYEDGIQKQGVLYDFLYDFLPLVIACIIVAVTMWYFVTWKPLVENVNRFSDYLYNQEKEAVEVYENCVLDKDKYYCVKGDKK